MEWITLNIDKESYECTDENTIVFIYPGELSSRNHVYRHLPEEGTGMYVFNRPDVVRAFMQSQRYPVIFSPNISDQDEYAYQAHMTRQFAPHQKAVETAATITEADIAEFHKQLEEDGVVGHMNELEEQ